MVCVCVGTLSKIKDYHSHDIYNIVWYVYELNGWLSPPPSISFPATGKWKQGTSNKEGETYTSIYISLPNLQQIKDTVATSGN